MEVFEVTCWHQTLAARIGLRLGGMAVLSLAWLAGARLYAEVHAQPARAATPGELGLCAVVVGCLLAGNALLVVGPGLWARVRVPGRWFPEATARRGRSGR